MARELGMPVWELRERMPSEEFTYWGIYYGRKAQREDIAQQMARR